MIYTIALVDPMDSEADPGFLSQLSEIDRRSGVQAEEREEIEDILQRVARDIRNMYTIGYVPSSDSRQVLPGARKEALRRVAVDVRLPTGQKLAVRTRRAYLAGADEAQSDAR